MAGDDSSAVPQPRLFTMQIIAASLIIGPLVALAIFASLRKNFPQAGAARTPIMTYVAVAFAAMMCVSQFVGRRVVRASARKRLAWENQPAFRTGSARQPFDWLSVYQNSMIIGMAPLEGATFFLGTAYLIEGELVALVVAGVLVLGLMVQFPNRTRVENWIERQKDSSPQERMP